jgi:transposase-like protein
VPALWVAQTEGTKFWLQVLAELHNGGVKLLHNLWVSGEV